VGDHREKQPSHFSVVKDFQLKPRKTFSAEELTYHPEEEQTAGIRAALFELSSKLQEKKHAVYFVICETLYK
jgi:hypothetical protein